MDDDMPPELEDFTENLEKIKGYRGNLKNHSYIHKTQRTKEKKMNLLGTTPSQLDKRIMKLISLCKKRRRRLRQILLRKNRKRRRR